MILITTSHSHNCVIPEWSSNVIDLRCKKIRIRMAFSSSFLTLRIRNSSQLHLLRILSIHLTPLALLTSDKIVCCLFSSAKFGLDWSSWQEQSSRQIKRKSRKWKINVFWCYKVNVLLRSAGTICPHALWFRISVPW